MVKGEAALSNSNRVMGVTLRCEAALWHSSDRTNISAFARFFLAASALLLMVTESIGSGAVVPSLIGLCYEGID